MSCGRVIRMGYYTSVEARCRIKPGHLEEVLNDITKAKEKCKNAEFVHYDDKDNYPTYFEYHLSDTVLESQGDRMFILPTDEDIKWYGMEEYIRWLIKHVDEGYFSWHGEECDDVGTIRWRDGKVFKTEMVETEVELDGFSN